MAGDDCGGFLASCGKRRAVRLAAGSGGCQPPTDVKVPGLSWPHFAAVIRIRPFRRLWLVLALSSLGDWLGLLATAAFATDRVSAPAAKGLAFGSVIAVQMIPALALGPLSGVLADRFDRRITMVYVDIFRCIMFASIPTVGLVLDRPGYVVAWAATAIFLVQTAGLLWVPAKEAAVPNLLPRSQLENANQLTLVTTYGITPVLAAVVLAWTTRLPSLGPVSSTDVALYFNALTFLASALVVAFGIPEISRHPPEDRRARPPSTVLRGFVEGWRFVVATPLLRGLVLGILGAFAGAGVVVGAAKFYAQSLGGGDATFAILFAIIFMGIAAGIVVGPPVVGRLSRRRWFALSIVFAGVATIVVAAAPRLAFAAGATLACGAGAGMAFLSGVTLLGAEVGDRMRGRVFAFVQTAVRVTLIWSIGATGVIVGIGSSRRFHLWLVTIDISTARVLLLLAGVCGALVGVTALRQMDDAPGVPVLADLWAAIIRRPQPGPRPQPTPPGGTTSDSGDPG
jgi:dTMP kinase